MTVQQFDEKQQPLMISGLHIAINRNERTVTDDEGNTKYEYDVEAFDVATKEDIDKEVEAHMLFLLHEYDKSNKVNIFYLNGNPAWLDKDTRVGLELRFKAEKASGKTDTTLWLNGTDLTINIDVGLQMLYALEVYASAAYDCTAQHKANVLALNTAKEKAEYDYTTDYPKTLRL